MQHRTIVNALISLICIAFAFGGMFSCVRNDSSNIIIDYRLKGKKHEEFDKILEYWKTSKYHNCMAESRLKMSCSGCEYVYIIVRISIDRSGRISGYTKAGENVCGQKAPEKLERCFMEYLESITFPPCLRNMTIETRLGTGLKC
jgi:hypothetical protein